MNAYEQFEVEDFLHDDFFIEWVLSPNKDADLFWSNWLLNHPERSSIVEKAQAVVRGLSIKPLEISLSDAEVQSIINHVQQHGYQQQHTKPIIKSIIATQWFKAAAVLLVAITVGGLIYRQSFSGKIADEKYIVINNNTSQSKLICMADGSLAVLHPNSTLRYPAHFSGKLRDVYLSGEAFFEVHKNAQKPFLVYSREMVTRVLGTSFTVRAFANAATFKVIVNRGRVLVYNNKAKSTKSASSSVTLLPNQEATYNHSSVTLKKDTLQTPLILSQEVAKRRFTFNNTPLSEIINRLNAAYDIHIEYDEQLLGDQRLTASLSDLSLDEKVKLISKAINAECSFKDGRIRILNP